MSKDCEPDALAMDAAEYAAWVARWHDMWGRLDALIRQLDGWTTPWLDESWRDGNPIFSAWSAKLRRGFRVVLHDDPEVFVTWRDSFGKRGSPGAVDELVISCAPTEQALWRAETIARAWLGGEARVAADEHDLAA